MIPLTPLSLDLPSPMGRGKRCRPAKKRKDAVSIKAEAGKGEKKTDNFQSRRSKRRKVTLPFPHERDMYASPGPKILSVRVHKIAVLCGVVGVKVPVSEVMQGTEERREEKNNARIIPSGRMHVRGRFC